MRIFLTKWWPFALLCFASFARFLVADNFPVVLPTATSLAVASGSIALCCAVFLGVNRIALPQKMVEGAWVAFAGALLLCGSACPLILHAADIVESDILLAGTLVPVVAAIAFAARGDAPLSAKALWPGVAASAALLLLFPEPRVHSLSGALTLVLLPTATGTGAVFASEERENKERWGVAFASLGACVVFAFAALLRHSGGSTFPWQACGFDLVIFSTTLVSVRRLGGRKYAAYFVFLPLSVFLYGLLLFRPRIDLRMGLGVAILLGSVVALLRTKDEVSDESFRLLA